MQSGLPCIALGPFVRALAQKSYEDFGIIKDQLQDIPRANRDKLLQFLPIARHKLIRFLVLIRYLKQNHSRIKALEKIHETIIKSEHQYVTVCQNFDSLYTEMVTSSEPPWDIHTALHVLTLGSYRNMPQIIDKTLTINSVRRLSPSFTSSTINKLNNALRVRLLSDKIPPELKLININKGMVFMIARNQFEIAISLRMRPKLLNDDKKDENERVRWSLFELKLLLKASNDINQSDDAQFIVSDIERDVLLLSVNNKMKSSKYPLQTMYKELNTFCGKLQFAVFNQQIHWIRYRYNDKNIRIEREYEKFITIRMWKHAALLPNDCYNIGDIDINKSYNHDEDNDNDNVLKEIQQKQKQQQQQWQQLQLQSKTNYSKKSKSIIGSSYFNTNTNTNLNMESLDEFERKENAIKSQFRITLSILYEEQCLDIKYHPRLPSFVEDDDDYKHLLCINPNALNVPKLIENFTILHCNYRLLYLLSKLIEVDKEYKIAPKVKAINGEHRKYILFSEQNLKQKHKIKIMKNLERKYIEICLFEAKCVEIYVNSNNGQIVFEKAYHQFVNTTRNIFEKNLRIYNEEINKDLTKISSIIRNLKIDCLLENIIYIVQNELNLDIVSYSVCNKPNKYIVYPSLLRLQLKKRKRNVTICEENEYGIYRSHIIQTYTEILNSWNENNSVFIKIPRFGSHCYLVIFYRSQTNAETYCIANDDFGNLLYIHNIILDEKPQYDERKGVIQISSHLITKYIEYCANILPQHLIRIMISLHIQKPITDLKWNVNNGIKFDIVLPCPAATSNLMHIIPRTFEFEIVLTRNMDWKCIVKQDTIFASHKESLLSKLDKTFKCEGNTLIFEYKNNVNIASFSLICNYCYKLLIVHNILKGFLDHKQTIKQNSAFYDVTFYSLKRIDLLNPQTIIEMEFILCNENKFILNIEIVWNDIDHVEYYIDPRFNPYIDNRDYNVSISFSDPSIFKWIPNLKLLITHYFNYRIKYHKKLNTLLRRQYTSDETFDCHDAMVKLKDLIGLWLKSSLMGKPQSYIFVEYESLSLMMFLQKLYWSVLTLNAVHPFIEGINGMHRWFYPFMDASISLCSTRYDTLRITSSFYCSDSDNILALRILNCCAVCLHVVDSHNGWQLTFKEIQFNDLSQNLLKHIENDLLRPKKRRLLCKIFGNEDNVKSKNNFLEIPLQNLMFSCLNSSLSPSFKSVLLLLHFVDNKLGLNKDSVNNKSVTLYSFEQLCAKYIRDRYSLSIDIVHIQFIDDVMKAYFYLMNQGYEAYHELKVQSFLSVLFESFMNFLKENNCVRSNNKIPQNQQIKRIAKPLLSIKELFALYYDEMLQLSIFSGTIMDGIVGANYFKNINTNLNKICSSNITQDNVFWYNLNHLNDEDIIYNENALCVEIHFAQICILKTRKSPSISPSINKVEKRGRRRRRKRGGKSNGYHESNRNPNDEIWIFDRYELKNHLFLNIGLSLDLNEIFFYNKYRNKFRKISIAFLPDLNALMNEINLELKQNAYLGTIIISFLRQFVIKLSKIKRNDETTFHTIWQQLKRLSHKL